MKRTISALAAMWASTGALPQGAPYAGFTEPFRRIDVAAAERGTVAKLCVREGERVTKGQPLAILDKEVLEVSRAIATTAADAKGKLESATAERDVRKT